MPVRESAGGEKRPVGEPGSTAAKMKDCRWTPVLVGQFEFVEWTPDNHLRHAGSSAFVRIGEPTVSTAKSDECCL
jgi:hypothetical protein